MSRKQTPESFWSRVDIRGPDECWPWTGSCNNTSYGTVAWDGKLYVAHRVAAWLEGLVTSPSAPKRKSDPGHVLHSCDTRQCCNPKHFFVGTQGDNIQDAYNKGRMVQPRGQHHANAKLTNEQAAAIRERYSSGELQVPLAAAYGVSQKAISLIVRGETYK